MIRVLIVEEHPLTQEGMAALIGVQPDMHVAAIATTGAEAVRLTRERSADVILVGRSVPDMDDVAVTEMLLREDPSAQILIVSSYDREQDVRRALQVGAHAYLPRDTLHAQLAPAVRAAAGLRNSSK